MDEPEYVNNWLKNGAAIADFYNENKSNKGFNSHLEELKRLYASTEDGTKCPLGKRPSDLENILVDLVLASPAVCMNRTFSKYGYEYESYLPSQIAKLFINRMNTPESIAAVELACGKKGDDDAHWMNVLTYSKEANIQAMLDEYAHLIVNGLIKQITSLNLCAVQ